MVKEHAFGASLTLPSMGCLVMSITPDPIAVNEKRRICSGRPESRPRSGVVRRRRPIRHKKPGVGSNVGTYAGNGGAGKPGGAGKAPGQPNQTKTYQSPDTPP
jgi:hypothetical protein